MERKQELQLFVVLLAAMKKMDVENAEMKKICEILPPRGNHCEYLSSFLPKLKQLTLYFV